MVVEAHNDQILCQIWRVAIVHTNLPDEHGELIGHFFSCFEEAQCAISTSHIWTAHTYEERSTKHIPLPPSVMNCNLKFADTKASSNVPKTTPLIKLLAKNFFLILVHPVYKM